MYLMYTKQYIIAVAVGMHWSIPDGILSLPIFVWVKIVI